MTLKECYLHIYPVYSSGGGGGGVAAQLYLPQKMTTHTLQYIAPRKNPGFGLPSRHFRLGAMGIARHVPCVLAGQAGPPTWCNLRGIYTATYRRERKSVLGNNAVLALDFFWLAQMVLLWGCGVCSLGR